MWIIFEGLDKSGKTTLEWEVMKATGFRHVIIDRGPVGYLVYDEILGRTNESRLVDYELQCEQIMQEENCLVVFCHSNLKTTIERLNKHNETPVVDNYEDMHESYNMFYLSRSIKLYNQGRQENVVCVNTSNQTIKECVEFIIKHISKKEEDNEYKEHE